MAHTKSGNPNDFILPDLGEGVHEAELIKWRVEVGQKVEEHDILAEMETDKALVEVPSPRSGVIAKLHGTEGEILHVGNPLVSYEGAAGSSAPAAAPAPASAKSNNGSAHKPAPSRTEEPPEPSADREDAGTVVGNMSGAAAGVAAQPGKALATPAVRRLARDLGVDIDSVRGTGIGGRVTENDVRGAASGGSRAGSAARSTRGAAQPTRKTGHGDVAPVDHDEPHSALVEDMPNLAARAGGSGSSGGRGAPAPARGSSMHSQAGDLAPTTSVGKAPPVRQAPSFPSGQDTVRIPFRGVRRTIANRLRESVNQAVHFNVMDEVDVSALDSLRKKLAAASGEKVSFLPFVASAVCRVLTDPRFRAMNATVDEKAGDDNYDAAIIQHRAVHLGIATDTDAGLMVPVIRDCDALGVLEISRQIAGIANAARTRSIPRDQLVGSTFTISNVGSHAGRFATPIINYPEVGILAVGRGRQAPVIRQTSGGPAFAIGLLLPLSLAGDHRVVDGATAALALARIVELLNDPEQLLGPARG